MASVSHLFRMVTIRRAHPMVTTIRGQECLHSLAWALLGQECLHTQVLGLHRMVRGCRQDQGWDLLSRVWVLHSQEWDHHKLDLGCLHSHNLVEWDLLNLELVLLSL